MGTSGIPDVVSNININFFFFLNRRLKFPNRVVSIWALDFTESWQGRVERGDGRERGGRPRELRWLGFKNAWFLHRVALSSIPSKGAIFVSIRGKFKKSIVCTLRGEEAFIPLPRTLPADTSNGKM